MTLALRTILLSAMLISISTKLLAETDVFREVQRSLEQDYYFHESRGHAAKARDSLLQAHSHLTSSPLTNSAEWQLLGRLETLLGNHDAAAAAYQHASRLTPHSLDLYMLTAVAYSRTGDLETALEQLLIAKSLSPDPQTTKRIDHYIERVQRVTLD